MNVFDRLENHFSSVSLTLVIIVVVVIFVFWRLKIRDGMMTPRESVDLIFSLAVAFVVVRREPQLALLHREDIVTMRSEELLRDCYLLVLKQALLVVFDGDFAKLRLSYAFSPFLHLSSHLVGVEFRSETDKLGDDLAIYFILH